MCSIVIPIENTDYEFYNVPNDVADVAKAIVALLKECENCESNIVTAESER